MPDFDAEERAGLRDFWEIYAANQATVQAATEAAALNIPDFAPVVKAMAPEQRDAQRRESMARLRLAIVEGDWGPYLANLSEQGAHYAHMDVRFGAWFELLGAFRTELLRPMGVAYGSDLARFSRAVLGMDRFVDLAMSAIGGAYIATKEAIIGQQQEAIRELSTPVLQVRDRLLVLPLVGLVDSVRARQLTEALLRTIRDRRAKVAIMDITGVPIVDSKVANHLVQTVRAARLMGAIVIMTGLSPEIAQTLVKLAADLGDVRTLGDLQSGIEEAERYLRLRVVSIDGAPAV